MDKRYFSDKIVEWYHEFKRDLPWRQTKDPYRIWLSEIILQQTRVVQGLPYYQAFVTRYPDVRALALAPEQEVLRMWQGLGYYTRARNLHKCAKVVAYEYKGVFPSSFAALLKLPGVGEYTAAAIASFSYGEPVAVVDGNVFRVISRIYGIETPINSPEGKKEYTVMANGLISKDRPDLHNQAMMEFGATHCTPKNPQCSTCIFNKACYAYAHNLQHALPVKIKAKESQQRYFHYFVFKKGKALAMRERTKRDIWLGLYDFPVDETPKLLKDKALVEKYSWLKEVNGKIEFSEVYKHVLTHQTIHCKFIIVNEAVDEIEMFENTTFYSLKKIADLPKPVLISRFLKDYNLL